MDLKPVFPVHNQSNPIGFHPYYNAFSDEELGWMGESWSKCDTEIHYSNLYNLGDCDLLTNIKSALGIRKYNEKCLLNLPLEYEYITKYSKIKSNM